MFGGGTMGVTHKLILPIGVFTNVKHVYAWGTQIKIFTEDIKMEFKASKSLTSLVKYACAYMSGRDTIDIIETMADCGKTPTTELLCKYPPRLLAFMENWKLEDDDDKKERVDEEKGATS